MDAHWHRSYCLYGSMILFYQDQKPQHYHHSHHLSRHDSCCSHHTRLRLWVKKWRKKTVYLYLFIKIQRLLISQCFRNPVTTQGSLTTPLLKFTIKTNFMSSSTSNLTFHSKITKPFTNSSSWFLSEKSQKFWQRHKATLSTWWNKWAELFLRQKS